MAPPRRARSAKGKGEVNEITRTLEQLCALDGRKTDVIYLKRECFQKLIKYMTTGIDMSSVFVPATKCVALSKSDLPLKKMLYLYLRSAARQNSSVSLLVVQTLLNDTKDIDPRIRGLAVRSMCSLRVPELLENVLPVVVEGLGDRHAYVREVSVIGVLKCYQQDADKSKELGLIEKVKVMLQTDTDTQVITSCLYVLQQLGALNSATLPKPLMISLMNNVRSFSEWGQCLLMGILLQHYRPETEEERFDVLEVLDFGLNHTNSAVIMASAKLFLHYTANYKEQYDKVLRLIKGPLRTLLVGREPEIAYAALANIKVLAERHPEQFYMMSNDFFYRPEDPSYLKLLKLDMLVTLSCGNNAFDTAEESLQYAKDHDDDVARHGIRAISRIAVKVENVDGILDRLLLFLGHRRLDIVSETVIAFASALNKFPDAAAICAPSIAEVQFSTLVDPEARSAFVWILGQFGGNIQEAPYILEDVCSGFENEDCTVKTAMLTAVVKLFCKRPPECLQLTKHVLSACISGPDYTLSERAAMYSALLDTLGKDQTASILELPAADYAGSGIVSGVTEDIKDKLFDEWNTLSVIYGQPAMTFIEDDGESLTRFESGSLGGDIVEQGGDHILMESSNAATELLDMTTEEDQGLKVEMESLEVQHDLLGGDSQPDLQAQLDNFSFDAPQSSENAQSTMDNGAAISDLDMLMGMVPNEPVQTRDTPGRAIGNGAPAEGTEEISLQSPGESIQMDQGQFKQLWDDLSIFSVTSEYTFESSNIVNAICSDRFSNFENHIKQANLICVGKPANGSGQPYRFFFHGKRKNSDDRVLLNIVVQNQVASIDVRSENINLSNHIKDMVTTLLLTF